MSVLKIKDANNQWQSIPAIKGADGANGIDGISPIATVSKSGNTATISITDKNGTTTTTISDGVNGANGRDGVIQYTAGTGITINDNVISASMPDATAKSLHYKMANDSVVHTYIIKETIRELDIITYLQGSLFKPELIKAINDAIGYFETGKKNVVMLFSPHPNHFVASVDFNNYNGTISQGWANLSIRVYNEYECSSLQPRMYLYVTDNQITRIDFSSITKTPMMIPCNNSTSFIPTQATHPATKGYVDDATNVNVITSSDSTYTIASLVGNTSYKLSEITALTITATTTFDRESVIYFTSGTTATTVSLPSSITNLGDAPTMTETSGVNSGTCTASKNYIIAIQNNIAVWKEY